MGADKRLTSTSACEDGKCKGPERWKVHVGKGSNHVPRFQDESEEASKVPTSQHAPQLHCCDKIWVILDRLTLLQQNKMTQIVQMVLRCYLVVYRHGGLCLVCLDSVQPGPGSGIRKSYVSNFGWQLIFTEAPVHS